MTELASAQESVTQSHPARVWMGVTLHRKIRTGEKHVPWSAVFMLAMMWFMWGFNVFAGGQALTFTIRKYSSNPQTISLVLTVAGVVMLGPVISYLSDQVWTRAGRRRPFLIVAWAGGFASMLSFAFLPQLAGAINHGLRAIGLPAVGELVILSICIASYKKLWDGAAALKPCFWNASRQTNAGDFGPCEECCLP